jgi:ferritin-like metal-binding protein YciE
MATKRERLIEWLRDAHAAEEQAEKMLSGTARQMDHDPEFRQALERHAAESEQQAQRLKECLHRLGEDTSLMKQLAGQFMAMGQTLSGYVVGDQPAKAALAIATFAQMEVTSYRILVAAAESAGETEIARTCEMLLAQEVDFSDWIDHETPQIVRRYLDREAGTASTMNDPSLARS